MKRFLRIIVAVAVLAGNFALCDAQSLRKGNFAEQCGWSEGETSVTIPAYVTAIPDYAFADIRELKSVFFAEGTKLKSIGKYAFAGCENLENIILPLSLTTLGDGCFRDCRSLSSINIPKWVRVIPTQAFRGCVGMREVFLPMRLSAIKSFAFAYCGQLKQLRLPASLTQIGNNAFSLCESLERVDIPDSVTSLESYAFSSCTGLRSVRLPNNPSELGELIFSGCTSLRLITEPSSRPPRFECESFLFDPDDEKAYEECELKVPDSARARYESSHGWNLFKTSLDSH